MTQTPPYPRILAIAPSTRGFGFVVLEGLALLVDWGSKPTDGKNKNIQAQAKAKALITRYQPSVIVLQNTALENSRRSQRVKRLIEQIAKMAQAHHVTVQLFTHDELKEALLPGGKGTKHELAAIIAQRFPDDLGPQLPSKRRPWESEHSRMDIFYAAALALMPRLKRATRKVQAKA